jgi:hypothetical protein
MKYMLLIIGDETAFEERSPEDAAAQMKLWDAYTQELVEAGALVSGEGLQPSTTATTLRLDDGERILTDGPFAETKEQILGFYVVDCRDLDEAIGWAEKLPSSQYGAKTEIRPVMDYEAAGAGDPTQAAQGATS